MDWSAFLERWSTIVANLIVIAGAIPAIRWGAATLREAREIRRRLPDQASVIGFVENANFQHIQLVREHSPDLWDIQWAPVPFVHVKPEEVRAVRAEITAKRLKNILAKDRKRLGQQQIVVGSVRLHGVGSGVIIGEVSRLDYVSGDAQWRRWLSDSRRWLLRKLLG